jgi:bacterioferritin
MQHAGKLVDRIMFLDGHPSLLTVAAMMIGQNLKVVLECDLTDEHIARDTYTKGRDIRHKHKDYVTMAIFEALLTNEKAHLDFLETQLDLLERIGVGNYGQLQAQLADAAEEKLRLLRRCCV